MTRYLALLLLLAACAEPEAPATPAPPSMRIEARKGPVRMLVELTPEKPRLSDRVELRLTVETAQEVEIDSPDLEIESFRVVDQRAEPMSLGEDGRRVFATVATLEPLKAGELAVGPFAVDFKVDGKDHRVETEAGVMVVTSAVQAEERDLALLEPALDPVAIEPRPVPALWPWIAGGALLLAVGLLLGLRRRRERAAPARVYTPTELAARELTALLADDPLARGEMQTFYSELTLIVRRYIERTTGVRAPEMTTQEFLRTNHSEGLRAFLESADLVKFAGDRPDRAAIEASLGRAREFVGMIEREAAA